MASKMDALMKDLNKTAKEEILAKGLSAYNYKKIPFTSPRMNYCTYGGIPVGKLIEFYGEEHGGKTTTALDIVANFQLLERQKAENDSTYVERSVLYCDCENTLDIEWAKKLNVDVDSMYVLQPKAQSAEQIFQLIEDAVETDEIGLFVIDSLGAMVSSGELDPKKTYEDKFYGGISMPLTRFSKKIEMLMTKHNCTGIGINQVREDLNSQWGGYTTPGGKAWKHLCAVRIQFSRGKFIDESGRELTRSAESPAGNFVQMSITKIKSAPPNRRTGFYTLNYTMGIDYLADLIEVAIKYGIIDKSGAWFTIDGVEDKIQGQNGVYKYLDENPEILKHVEELIDQQIL
jgi:recombination protein RecA